MDIKQLRYGNCVSLSETYRNVGDLLILDQSKFEALIVFKSYDRIYPIPLTIDWLLIFGFEHIHDDLFKLHITESVILIANLNYLSQDVAICINNQRFYVGKKYVHELQNLYFSLKRRDLDLNIRDEFTPPTLQQAVDRLNKAFSNE